MRTIHTDEITKCIKEMCMQVNVDLSPDVKDALLAGKEKEESTIGKQILEQLEKNLEIAKESQIPICQDTGMTVVFLRIGQEVHIDGDFLEDAVNEGIRQGYAEGYLRKSVVSDPILRENTKDNTPGVIHYEIVPGDRLEITVAPKGFGSENMSRIAMLRPSDGLDGIKQFVLDAVLQAGPNPCPPIVVGVGLGGTFDKAALLAKKALLRETGGHNEDPFYAELERELLERINALGIGPQGFGGKTTAIGLNIETMPTHIAGMPCAVNINCHVTRHKTEVL